MGRATFLLGFAVGSVLVLLALMSGGDDAAAPPSSSSPRHPVGGDTGVDARPTAASERSLRRPADAEPSPVDASPAHAPPPPRAAAGNVRIAVPLLLTSLEYHGTSLLATTLQGWVKNLFVPQGNVDLLLFYDEAAISHQQLLTTLKLHAVPPPPAGATGHTARLVQLAAPVHVARTMFAPATDFVVYLLPTRLPLPTFLQEMPAKPRQSILSGDNVSWMRCGCPPYCPVKRATEGYVQGTRWYTHQLFLERDRLLQRVYAYWIKLDVDIWLFKPLPFNIADEMRRPRFPVASTAGSTRPQQQAQAVAKGDAVPGDASAAEFTAVTEAPTPTPSEAAATSSVRLEAARWSDDWGPHAAVPAAAEAATVVEGALIAHTGYQYNGHGCSDNLHRAIWTWFNDTSPTADGRPGRPGPKMPVSRGRKWWEQDDNVYWSNFIVTSVAFHASPNGPLALAKFLNEFRDGFFRHRWTDQSLFHKVLGAFAGPNETRHVLDWTCLRWDKKRFRPHAVFYHSKQAKKGSLLRQKTAFEQQPFLGRSPCD